MAYDEDLAARVRAAVPDLPEKRMFGGLAFMLGGNLAVCVTDDAVLVRLPPEEVPDALAGPGVRPFVMGEREAKGWVLVDVAAVPDEASLGSWVDRGLARARSLPEK